MNLASLLQRQAEEAPDRPALIEKRGLSRRLLTFRQLDAAAARVAATLRAVGFKPGDTILLLLNMSLDLYVILTGVMRAGCVAMFVDPGVGIAHLNRSCELLPPRGFFGTRRAQWLRLLSRQLRAIPHNFCLDGYCPGAITWRHEAACVAAEVPATLDPSAPALVTFTSGTGGDPKAAVRTHGFLAAQHRALVAPLDLRAGEVDLATLPIFVLANLASGMTTILPDAELRRPEKICCEALWDQIRVESPTRLTASPAFLNRLMRASDIPAARGGQFRKIFTGGSPVFPNFLDRLQQWAPHARIVTVYGASEAEPIATLAPEDIASADRAVMARGGGLLVGYPVESVQLRILPNDWGKPIAPMTAAAFQRQICPSGKAGEIVVSGSHVLAGYLNGKGDAETKFRVEDAIWHRTGDAGFQDERGRLWLLGRCAGQDDQATDLYPLAVETAAHLHAELRHAALVCPNGKRILLIEADQSVNVGQLNERLAWARLDTVRQVKRLPVDSRHHGKILYQRLAKHARAEAGRLPSASGA